MSKIKAQCYHCGKPIMKSENTYLTLKDVLSKEQIEDVITHLKISKNGFPPGSVVDRVIQDLITLFEEVNVC